MTKKRLLSIPLLALVVLSVLAPQARPVSAQTLGYFDYPIYSGSVSNGTRCWTYTWDKTEVKGFHITRSGSRFAVYGGGTIWTNQSWTTVTNAFTAPGANYAAMLPGETHVNVTTWNLDSDTETVCYIFEAAQTIELSIRYYGEDWQVTSTPTITPECDEDDLTCKLRHYWPMDELGDNPDRLDNMGGATLQTTQVVGGNDVPGTEYSKYGAGAAQFTGDSFLMSKTSPETLSIASDGWSIAGWIRPQGAGGSTQITHKSSEYSLTTTADNKITFTAGSTTITSANPVTMDAWHLVSVIYDGSEYSLQVDAETPVTSSGDAPSTGPGPIIYGDPFNGRLDEWHIWERAITQDQRDTLWNQGEGCFYPWYGGCNPRGLDELLDGGMEQYPSSTGWVMLSGSEDFGMRVNRNTLIGWLQFTTIGPSRCGDGYHRLRTDVLTAEDMPISQIFTWLGGDFYWKVSTRGQRGIFGSVIAPELQPRAHVTLIDVFSDEEYILIDDPEAEPQTGSWKVNSGVITGLPESNYKIILASYESAAVDYDDVAIGTGPLDEACTERIEPSATPSATATTEPTDPPIDPTQMLWTNTPGPSPTPSSLLLSNCGFEVANHAGWTLNAQSFINSVGGPIGPYYLVAQGNPGAYQSVFSSSAQTLYFTSYVLGYASIRLVNASNGSIVTVYSAYTSTWTQIKRTANVTAGTWRVELGSSAGYSAAGFDGIDVSKNGYTSSGFCVNTPTPGPTAFVEPTITPSRSPTTAPTITATWVTATPGPTSTPYGTPGGAEGPYTSTPNSIQITGTAAWAGTATADAGTIGTYTPAPAPSGTPSTGGWNGGDMPPGEGGGDTGPTPTMPSSWNPGDPPPASDAAGYWENVPCTGDSCNVSQTSWIPGFGSLELPGTGDMPTNWFGGGDGGSYEFHECVKPTNPWSVSWWIDYERCLIFSFFSWGPKQHGLVSGIPATFTQLEPFGTIAEVGEGMVIMRTQVAGIQNEIGYDGVNDPINPGEILGGSNGNDPWGENAQLHLFDNTGGITTGAYTGYCTHRLSDALSGNLANGACFALNVMKNVGVFPWVQFMINVASILSIVVSAFKIIGVAGSAAVVYAPTGDDEEVE